MILKHNKYQKDITIACQNLSNKSSWQ